MGELKEMLDLASKYGRIKTLEFDPEQVRGRVKYFHVEFYPPSATQQPVQTQVLPPATDMPPDDVMLFASAPFFDDIVKVEE